MWKNLNRSNYSFQVFTNFKGILTGIWSSTSILLMLKLTWPFAKKNSKRLGSRCNSGCRGPSLNILLMTTIISGWWYTYPSEKIQFFSWEYEIPNIWKIKHVPHHQPDNIWMLIKGDINQHEPVEYLSIFSPVLKVDKGSHWILLHQSTIIPYHSQIGTMSSTKEL